MKNIHRRKPVHSHSAPNLASLPPLTESERKGYKEDIERLTSDKESLHVELQRHIEEQEGLKVQMKALSERVQNVKHGHSNMLSSLSETLSQTAFSMDLMPRGKGHDRKRRFPGGSYLFEETNTEDNQRAASQISTIENSDTNSLLTFNKELLEQLESSLTFWEKMLLDVSEGLLQHNSSLELVESTSCGPSTSICYTQLNVDAGGKTSGIDMNSEPKSGLALEVQRPAEEQAIVAATNVRSGVNDVFWEQFLTENPGSNDSAEPHRSGQIDAEGKKNGDRPIDRGMYWWNMSSVNNLAEQLGHLTPAERT